jgi:hypothetical protein
MTDRRPATVCPVRVSAVCPPGARRCPDFQVARDGRAGKPAR